MAHLLTDEETEAQLDGTRPGGQVSCLVPVSSSIPLHQPLPAQKEHSALPLILLTFAHQFGFVVVVVLGGFVSPFSTGGLS